MEYTSEKHHSKAKKASWESNEPPFSCEEYKSSILTNLSFYNCEVESDVKKTWVLEYWSAAGKDVSGLDRLHDAQFDQLGVLVRLIHRGFTLQQNHHDYLEKRYKELKESVKRTRSVIPDKVKVKQSSDEKFLDQKSDFCSEIDAELDSIFKNGKRSINIKSLAAGKGISPGACKLVAESYQTQIEELTSVINSDNQDLKAGY